MSNTATFTHARNVAIAVELLVLTWLVFTEDVREVGLFLLLLSGALAIAGLISSNWPLGAISLLLLGSATPRLTTTLFGLHLRPEHVFIAFVGLALCAKSITGNKPPALDLRNYDYLLIVYVALNFLASALTSPEPRMTLRWACLNAIVIGPYFLLRWLVRDADSLWRSMQILLGVGGVEAAYGIFSFLSNRIFNTSFGVAVEQYGAIPGIHGTQYEANLFGSYTACCAVMFFAFYLLSQGPRRTKYAWGFAITTLGALVSLARSVLIALPLVALLVLWAALKGRQLRMRRLLPLVTGATALILIFSPLIMKFAIDRFSTIDLSELSSDPTTTGRLIQTAAALENVHAHPILGTGTASFQLLFNWDDYLPGMAGDAEQAGWIGNSPLRILHDTGVLGLATFLLFVCFLAVAARKALRIADERTRICLVALSAGLVLYAITFQATEATILAFTWVHLGLLAAALEIARRARFPAESID
jgi:O-antigen ligase